MELRVVVVPVVVVPVVGGASCPVRVVVVRVVGIRSKFYPFFENPNVLSLPHTHFVF